jgi:hypothetical protein
MKNLNVLILSALAGLSGCGRGGPASSAAPEKIEGPDVKTLSHDQLMSALHECHQYGSSDDPRVKYTIRYCSAVQSAHSMEGYSAPSSAVVDPTVNKVH